MIITPYQRDSSGKVISYRSGEVKARVGEQTLVIANELVGPSALDVIWLAFLRAKVAQWNIGR